MESRFSTSKKKDYNFASADSVLSELLRNRKGMADIKKCWNIFLERSEERKNLVNNLEEKKYSSDFEWIENKKVCVVSANTIFRFVEEELKHDNVEVKTEYGQSLESMSTGERKRVYLSYELDKKPEVVVLDHFFDNLDKETRAFFANWLHELLAEVDVLHVYSRMEDKLRFANRDLTFAHGKLILQAVEMVSHVSENVNEWGALPEAPEQIKIDSEYLVAFNGVSVAYGSKRILDAVEWRIGKGEFWHLRGPNGSGKTTLLSMIVGDNPKAYGQNLFLFGKKKGSGESIWDIKRLVGYFTSNMTFRFWRMQSIEKMIVSGFYDSIGLYTQPGDYQMKLTKEWLRFMKLDEFAQVPFVKMSLCHQRMVMIARAMVKHPPLLILDEPTVDLDEANARLVVELINGIAKESETTIVFVSHRNEPGLVAKDTVDLVVGKNGSVAVVLQE